MTIGFILLLIGLSQAVWAAWAIRTDAAKDHISLIEAAVLRLTSSEALPKSRMGLAFDHLLEWVALILGVIFFVMGFMILLWEFS